MRFVPAVIVDVVLVLVFAVIGRASHEEDPAGFLLTAWPFLVALLLGHLVAALLPGRPRRPWSVLWGLVVWVITVMGGLLLRIASGDTAQVPFIIVATLTLGVLLIGWRAGTALLRRRRAVTPASQNATDATDADGFADADRSGRVEAVGPADETSADDVPHAPSGQSDETRD